MLPSQSRLNEIGQLLDNVHETFGRTITAYKDAENTIVATTSSYNAIYGANNSNVSKSTVSVAFTARIAYLDSEETPLLDDEIESQRKLQLPMGSVRIKVDQTGFDFIKEAKRIDLDGARYIIDNDSSTEAVGPFSVNYYIFYLRPFDEY